MTSNTEHTSDNKGLAKEPSAASSRPVRPLSPKTKTKAPRYRDINEDDDGYHPYADRIEIEPLFEEDPWR